MQRGLCCEPAGSDALGGRGGRVEFLEAGAAFARGAEFEVGALVVCAGWALDQRRVGVVACAGGERGGCAEGGVAFVAGAAGGDGGGEEGVCHCGGVLNGEFCVW